MGCGYRLWLRKAKKKEVSKAVDPEKVLEKLMEGKLSSSEALRVLKSVDLKLAVKDAGSRKKVINYLIESVEEGKLGAADVEELLKRLGVNVSAYDELLRQAQRISFQKNPVLAKKLKEYNAEMDKKILEEHKEIFDAALRLYSEGKVDESVMKRLGKNLGLSSWSDWFVRKQEHSPKVLKRKKSKRFK